MLILCVSKRKKSMEVLFHFIFELVKIGVLASIYAAILLFVFARINKSNSESWFQKITANKKKFWFVSGAIISILLFVWMFTYWGNHGLGDSARIPIGHGKEIEQINGNWSFISPNGHEYEMFTIQSFAVKDNFCVGETEQNSYYIWNLETNDVETIKTLKEYQVKAENLNLPNLHEFKSFWDGYQKYWGGWKFWFLP